MHYDVFNGDADGIIALLQLRLVEPKQSKLITGVKRDIALLKQVVEYDDASSVTVLDISMEKNADPLKILLNNGIPLFYCDHHRTGIIPESILLNTLIDLDAETCTSLLINKKLKGRHQTWALAAAFGDNLHKTGYKIANELSLSTEQTEFLKELGTLINYNGYGATLADLHIEPALLYKQLLDFTDPFDLLNDPESPYFTLQKSHQLDMQHLDALKPYYSNAQCCVYLLPNKAWARRISGVFGNDLANKNPDLAHAVITLNPDNTDYTISVRAPINNRIGADDVCCQFVTGGGRKAAAGINKLPLNEREKFIQTLSQYYKINLTR